MSEAVRGVDVVVAGRTRALNTFFPSVTRLNNGELLCVFYYSPAHVHPRGKIALVRSRDDGNSWTLPEVIIDTPNDDRDPHIVQLKDGRLILSWFTTYHAMEPRISKSFVAISNDYGWTWSKPIAVSSEGFATSEKVLELDDGTLLLPVYDSRNSILFESRDGGEHWEQVANITKAEKMNAGITFNETALASLGDDHIVAVMRTAGGDGYAYISHSYDRGRSWDQPVALPVKAHAPDLLVLDRGVFLTYGSIAFPGRWVAAVLETVMEVRGTVDEPVENIVFAGLTFRYGSWMTPSQEGISTLQADVISRGVGQTGAALQGMEIPGNIKIEAAHNIQLVDSVIEHMGAAGLSLRNGVQHMVIEGNIFRDISAAAIVVGRMADAYPADGRQVCRFNRISNNVIYNVANEYWGSCGITALFVEGLEISHNEIFQVPYSGISVGWGWTMHPQSTTARGNIIQKNHVRYFGEKMFDLGGVYTLGQQPGSLIRGNLIHDQFAPFAGVYLDSGSAGFTLTENITYNTPFDLQMPQEGLKDNLVYDNYWGVAPGARDEDWNPAYSGGAYQAKPADASFPMALAKAAGLKEECKHLLQGITVGPSPKALLDPVSPREEQDVVIVQVGGPGYVETGRWEVSGLPGLISHTSRFTSVAGSTARWAPQLVPGEYRVLFYVVTHPNSHPGAEVRVVSAQGETVRTVDFSQGEAHLLDLGVYTFTGDGGYVELRCLPDGKGFIRAADVVFERVTR